MTADRSQPITMTTYAIGDVQGCYAALAGLLDKLAFASTDRLWLVGDLVNRGPQSLEVLRLVKGLGGRAVTVLGNHDLHLLALAEGASKSGRGDTLDAVLAAPDRTELLAWLRSRRLAYAEGEYLMVHAGLLPQWSAADVIARAREVEAALAAEPRAPFLRAMYGNFPAAWSDELSGAERLRVIVNAMTRMRFCDSHGNIELGEKGGPERAPPGYYAWFEAPGRKTADLTVVCGHWSAMGYVQRPGVIALDSGCVWGGCLTAVNLEDRQATQLACASAEPRAR
jgi:bis(5'-nucleosyl)-tetraphosphatase (symmetrical)